jgi:hypothetical protein
VSSRFGATHKARGRYWATILAAPLLIILASCSSAESPQVASVTDAGSQPPPSASSTTNNDDGLAFAKCMRENGVDLPDPDPDGGFGFGDGSDELNLNDPKFQKGFAECQELMPGGSPLDRSLDATQQDAVFELTKCMRKNGIDIPDPQFDANGKLVLSSILGSIDFSDPKLRKALEKCRSLIPTDLAGP